MNVMKSIRFTALAAVLCVCHTWSGGSSLVATSVHCDEICGEYAACDTSCIYVPGPEYEAIQTTCGEYGVCETPCECGDGLCNGDLSGCTETCGTCPGDCGGPCLEPTEVGYCGQCTTDSQCGDEHYCDAKTCCVYSENQPKGPGTPPCFFNDDCNYQDSYICRNHECVKSGNTYCAVDDDCSVLPGENICEYGRCKAGHRE